MLNLRPAEMNNKLSNLRHPLGFTLLELMLAFAMFSLILLATYNVINHASRTKELAKRRADFLRAGVAFLTRLERELAAVYIERNVAGGQHTIFFAEDNQAMLPRDALTFTCRCNELWTFGLEDSNRIPHVEVAYDFMQNQDSDEREELLFRRQDDTMDDDPQNGGIRDALWPSIRGLNLRYLDPVDKVWKDNWDSREKSEAKLPQAVEITIWLAELEDYGREPVNPLILGKTVIIPTVFPKRAR